MQPTLIGSSSISKQPRRDFVRSKNHLAPNVDRRVLTLLLPESASQQRDCSRRSQAISRCEQSSASCICRQGIFQTSSLGSASPAPRLHRPSEGGTALR